GLAGAAVGEIALPDEEAVEGAVLIGLPPDVEVGAVEALGGAGPGGRSGRAGRGHGASPSVVAWSVTVSSKGEVDGEARGPKRPMRGFHPEPTSSSHSSTHMATGRQSPTTPHLVQGSPAKWSESSWS